MPRIDPLSLLKCLGVLLGPNGGIKGKAEVERLAGLMIKFSKKLVSKCIYIQILKSTDPELLSQFMGAGGWNLIHMWLTDGIVAKNWALVQELLELLLLCPVDVDRLKSNNCPKLIKGLSKEGSHQGVRMLAGKLVEQWLKLVKGETPPNTVPTQISVVNNVSTSNATYTPSVVVNSLVNATAVSRQGDKTKTDEATNSIESTTVRVQDLALNTSHAQDSQQFLQPQQPQKIHLQPVQLQLINKALPGQLQSSQIKSQFVVVENYQNQSTSIRYKIILRDGKQVLTKLETDASKVSNNINNDSDSNVDNKMDIKQDSILNDDDNNKMLENGQVYDSNNDNGVGIKLDDNSTVVKEEADVATNDQVDSSKVNTEDNVNSESNNKSSDKENRDSQKKDDKLSNTSSSSDKKSSHSSSSRSSSKNSSSSSRSSSRKSSSSHRAGSSSSKGSSSSSKSSKDKDRHHSSSSSKHSSSSSSRSKSDKEKERDKEKEKQKKDQAEKDKATLEKVQGQSLSNKIGKIPKKKPEDEKSGDSLRKTSTDSRDSSKENKDKDKGDSKKPSSPTILEKKNISISIENRKNSQESSRPKTVKTFNSKFRSTGLEEEVKPPPPRTAGKKPSTTTTTVTADKKIVPPKLPVKRSSPIRESGASAEKKAKVSLDPTNSPSEDKKGAIKLIAPKPKQNNVADDEPVRVLYHWILFSSSNKTYESMFSQKTTSHRHVLLCHSRVAMVLQESDMFMDALTASTKSKEPRKRKRRTSVSKDGSSDAKKSDGTNSVSGDHGARDTTPPPTSPSHNTDDRSPVSMKPEFKFYQDTLETDEDKEDKERVQNDKDDDLLDDKVNNKGVNDEDDERSRTPTCDDESEVKAPASPDDPEDSGRAPTPNEDIRYVDGLRSVLLLQKRKGPKKSLKWKTDLESVRYFELDETERVNVTKTFTDAKNMEKMNEREAFQMARKLSTEDLMEEKTRWKALIPIDLPAPLADPGKDSKEKDIQYAREKGILQALYFNRNMIPDSPAEPDEERHHIFTDPKIIPLDDISENASKDSDKDFTAVPWPEPKPQQATPVIPNVHFPTFPQHNQVIPGMPMPNQMGPMNMPPQQIPPPMIQPPMNHMQPIQDVSGAGGWRTGDGKVVVPDIAMNNIPNMPGNMNHNYPPPGMDPSMMPPNMMGPPGMFNQQDGYPNMMPEDGSFGHMPNNFQGPGMFGPPGPGPGPNFPNGPPPRGVGPMHGNRGRGGPPGPPGWFRGGGNPGVGPPMRGGWGGRGGWRGNGKQPPVCRQFTKSGYCRVGDKCQYLHPGVNCPPF
ncbi:hypothetical protein G9C98_007610 [Cotesia typhae]|uniref:Serine/threonine-protein phosphatase 1 regulatory subunit 10 n=1 Tax=Cotesia typhae TaxID=2053667 RepID=A0A8J5V5N8_9HYME|nr:hypothetical protein G9C98_007610 [Cotesia typhae]